MSDSLITQYQGKLLEVKNLPSLPAAIEEIQSRLDNPNCSTELLAQIIDRDQALASKVLRMVNSPIYGFPGRIASIQNALVLLGINVIKGIILSCAVFDAMNQKMVGLWEHSIACSLASVSIAKVLGEEHTEEYSIMGLLHDIGKVVFIMQIPEAYQETTKLVKEEDIFFFEAEKRVLGFSHDRVNEWICEHWNLPLILREPMIHHHDPMRAQFHKNYACVVHVADFMARLFSCGSGGDNNVPNLDPQALKYLNLNHTKIEKIVDELTDVYSDMTSVMVI